MAEIGVYMYAVTRGAGADAVADTVGLEGRQVRVVEHDGLSALVSNVDLDEYGEAGLRRNLEDLAWLEKVARGHDDVVQLAATHGPTAPMRLATIFLGDDEVRQRLEQWQHPLTDVLDRVEGRQEWSIKAFTSSGETDPATTTADESGASYLRRKRSERTRRELDAADAQQVADSLHDLLAGFVVATRRLPPQDKRLSGHLGTMILNGAYLVDDSRGGEFTDLVEQVSRGLVEGTSVQVAGPWPPYSFAMLEES